MPSPQRWTADTYRQIAIQALPHVERGKPLARAFFEAQKQVLPADQHISIDEMTQRNSGGRFRKYVEDVRKHPPQPRISVPGMPDVAALNTDQLAALDFGNGIVRWTPEEWARIARDVRRREANGDKRNVARLVFEAMLENLPRNRWRQWGGISQAQGSGKLADQLREGWTWGVDRLPGYMHPGPLAAATPPATNPPPTANPPLAPPVPTPPPPAAPPVTVAAPQFSPMFAGVAPVAPVATSTSTSSTAPAGILAAPSHAAATFAQDIAQAVEKLLAAQAASLVAQMELRIAATAERIASTVADRLNDAMRQTVVATIAQELGGPVTEPAQQPAQKPAQARETIPYDLAPEPAPVEPPPTVLREPVEPPPPGAPFKLRADVLGMKGNTDRKSVV